NGKVTDSSLTMTYNGKSVDTVTTSDEDSIYWSMALPRSAHDLTVSSGTVYVGFRLLNGWNLTGVIPTCWTDMMAVSLP
ncbi:MAG: hypothetical protein IIU09_04590, partial [Bacteroidales bacterium]|nr:hypothetical protein [Bacteroidales bacterium]